MFPHAGCSRLGEFGLIIKMEKVKSLSVVSQSVTGFHMSERIVGLLTKRSILIIVRIYSGGGFSADTLIYNIQLLNNPSHSCLQVL